MAQPMHAITRKQLTVQHRKLTAKTSDASQVGRNRAPTRVEKKPPYTGTMINIASILPILRPAANMSVLPRQTRCR